jgi:hypothetical protein
VIELLGAFQVVDGEMHGANAGFGGEGVRGHAMPFSNDYSLVSGLLEPIRKIVEKRDVIC